MSTVGKLFTEMVLKDEKFRQDMDRLEARAKISKSTLNELSNITIDPKGNIVERTKNVESHNKKLSETEKAYRSFYQEQRLQDRTFREGTNAILGITTALTLLTKGNDDTSTSVKRIGESLLATVIAINTVEFSMFSLGQMGDKLGGSFGKLLSRISSFAGPISILVGVGAGLIAFFREANMEAKKAAEEGLKQFNDEFSKIGKKDKVETVANIEAKLKLLKAQEMDLQAKANNAQYSYRSKDGNVLVKKVFRDTTFDNSLKATKDEVVYYQSMLESAKKLQEEERKRAEDLARANGVLVNQQSRLQEIAKLQKENSQQLTTGKALDNDRVLTNKELRNLADSNAKLEAEKKSLTQSTAELEEEQKKIMEEQLAIQKEMDKSIVSRNDALSEQIEFERLLYEAGKQTKAEYIAQLRAVQQRAGDGEISLQIEAEINRTLKEEGASSRQILQDRVSLIQIHYQLKEITSETAIAQLQALEKETTDTVEIAKIRKMISDIQLDTSEKQSRALDQQLDQYQRIGSLLERSFSKSGDDFIAKLSQGLQIAVNIARVMSAANKKEGGASPMDFLEVIGNILGFGALFDSGGHTGYGNPKQPAGIVHADEIVFENDIVKNNRSGLMALRAQLQKGRSFEDLMNSGVPSQISSGAEARRAVQTFVPKFIAGESQGLSSGQDMSVLVKEIRTLRTVIENMPPPIVEVKNPITLGEGLRTEMPKYQKFANEKFVDE